MTSIDSIVPYNVKLSKFAIIVKWEFKY